MQLFSEENITFQEKIVERSGMGEKTYLSDGEPQLQHACTISTAAQEQGCSKLQCDACALQVYSDRRMTRAPQRMMSVWPSPR